MEDSRVLRFQKYLVNNMKEQAVVNQTFTPFGKCLGMRLLIKLELKAKVKYSLLPYSL